ncbi:MAG: diacylglycerol kinase family protein [Bacteroidales bacterium]|nr:diacylglycerol kinase family protein [Bacteroidales bacterium]
MRNTGKKFSLIERIQSFRYAFQGVFYLLRTQHNAWIHTFAAIVVILLGIYFNITRNEWIGIILAIGAVFSLEAVNTAIEKLTDIISPEYHDKAKRAKDLAAGAVLITAIAALAVGLIIFVPYLVEL